ncbi:hypothetical protein T01_10737 [Trichinella spiralis]|uniref:CCHC-type domain-containing protein n=1 Tax=Trichinella spiralis TaxID=6334 RepID=A0A0V1BSN7_TRISP|nr:hypothetical protein T01_10737 [Trichinella spiralis]
MEMYFRAADVPSEQRAALVQYYTDAEVNDVRVCPSVRRAVVRTAAPEGIPPPEGAADSVFLLQFKSGRCLDAITRLTVNISSVPTPMLKLRSVKTREQKLWRQRHRKLPFEAEEQETRLKELLTEEIPATTRKMEARRRRRARSGHKNCWSCGGVGHISQDCDMCNGRGRASGELQLRLKSDMLVDTGIAVTLAVMEFNQSSVVLWNVPISTIWLEAASGTELVVTSACVMKIELGDLV